MVNFCMAAKTKKNYKHHMMYDPRTGAGRMTKSYADHLALKNRGWSHTPRDPLKAKMVNSYRNKKY